MITSKIEAKIFVLGIACETGIDDNMQNVDATLLDETTEDYKPTKK